MYRFAVLYVSSERFWGSSFGGAMGYHFPIYCNFRSVARYSRSKIENRKNPRRSLKKSTILNLVRVLFYFRVTPRRSTCPQQLRTTELKCRTSTVLVAYEILNSNT